MSAESRDTVQRFTDRVAFYVRYRPHYPRTLVEHLAREGVLAEDSAVADIGSGPGFLSEVFLCHGCTVYGVEPNAAMRAAAESLLAVYPRFHSVEGTAEATGLPDASVDWVVAGQAFHFFDPVAARAEFLRILRGRRYAAVCWNERDPDGSPFMVAYDALLRRHVPDYKDLSRHVGKVNYEALFGHSDYRYDTVANERPFDREGVTDRLRAASYAPQPGEPGHAELVADLNALFDQHQQDGQVAFTYVTKAYWGALAGGA